MIKYYCDKCGKEMENIEYTITPKKFEMMNRAYIPLEDIDLCKECFERYYGER